MALFPWYSAHCWWSITQTIYVLLLYRLRYSLQIESITMIELFLPCIYFLSNGSWYIYQSHFVSPSSVRNLGNNIGFGACSILILMGKKLAVVSLFPDWIHGFYSSFLNFYGFQKNVKKYLTRLNRIVFLICSLIFPCSILTNVFWN